MTMVRLHNTTFHPEPIGLLRTIPSQARFHILFIFVGDEIDMHGGGHSKSDHAITFDTLSLFCRFMHAT